MKLSGWNLSQINVVHLRLTWIIITIKQSKYTGKPINNLSDEGKLINYEDGPNKFSVTKYLIYKK